MEVGWNYRANVLTQEVIMILRFLLFLSFLMPATAMAQEVVLAWDAPEDRGKIIGYHVFRCEYDFANRKCEWEKLTPDPLSLDVLTYTDTTRSADKSVAYYVAATDGANYSEPSNLAFTDIFGPREAVKGFRIEME